MPRTPLLPGERRRPINAVAPDDTRADRPTKKPSCSFVYGISSPREFRIQRGKKLIDLIESKTVDYSLATGWDALDKIRRKSVRRWRNNVISLMAAECGGDLKMLMALTHAILDYFSETMLRCSAGSTALLCPDDCEALEVARKKFVT